MKTCPICRQTSGHILFSAKDERFHATSNTYDIVQCSHCGFAFTSPPPSTEELAALYPEGFHHEPGALEQWLIHRSRRTILRDLRQLHPTAHQLLDVGCGTGGFLLAARQAGFTVAGTEFSERAVAAARAKGLTVFSGPLATAVETRPQFDVITMLHVLEHIAEPLDELRRVRDLLNPGGLAVIEVPAFHSWERKVFQSHWLHLDIPRHLNHFTSDSLSRALRDTGFDIVHTRFHLPETAPLGSWHSFIRSRVYAEPGGPAPSPTKVGRVFLAALFGPVVLSSLMLRFLIPRYASPVMRYYAQATP